MPEDFYPKQPTQKALVSSGFIYIIAVEKKKKSPKMKNMSCLNPILAVSIMKNHDDKHVLKFIPSSEIEHIKDKKWVYGADEVFLLPCMKCKPCRDAYAKDWAIRCTLEAQMHKFNYFLTLTYDEHHVAYACKEDLTKFLKNLGYFLTGKPKRPQFFACMERGENTNRLHFHCVLFLDKSLVLKRPIKLGSFYHFSCADLDRIWSNGFVDVATFASDCARYVAKYSTKQGKCFMSRNLARSYYESKKYEIVNDGFKVYGSFFGSEYSDIPKCFVKWFLADQFDEANSFKLSKKKLQMLLVSQQVRNMSLSGESDVIKNKILLFLQKDKFSKERIDL